MTPEPPLPEPPSSGPPGAGPAPGGPPKSLRGRVSAGLAWLTIDTCGRMVAQSIAQFVLAILLVPADFGLIAMARTVVTVGNIVERGGLHTLLVQRHAEFRRWVTPVFWIGSVLGLGSALAILALAPVAMWFYGEPGLLGLLAVLALTPLIEGHGVTGRASLQAQLKFRQLAMIALSSGIVLSGLTIVFAALGFGVYSFVIPMPIAAAFRITLLLWFGRPPVRLRLDLHEWRNLRRDVWHLLTANIVVKLTEQMDKILLGRFAEAKILGFYQFAFMISVANFRLFGKNLDRVLVPSLSHLQSDPQRSIRAYLAAASSLLVVGTPLCWTLAGCAEPLIRLINYDKWAPAIPVLQLLAIGMSLRVAYFSSASLIKSQGRFSLFQKITIANAIVFATAVGIGAWYGGAVGTAIGFVGTAGTFGPLIVWLAIRHGGGTVGDVVRLYVPPALMSVASVVPAVLLARTVPDDWRVVGPICEILLTGLVAAAIYAILAWTFVRPTCRTILEQVRQLADRIRGRRAPADTPPAPDG